MYENVPMRHVETIPWEGGKWMIRRMMERVNLTKIYFKPFVNVTIYPQYNNNMLTKSTGLTYICTYMCVYTHIYTYIYTHTCTHMTRG
jgi:hypothetical protein